MRILFSIIINAFILFIVAFLLRANPEKGIVDGVILGCSGCDFNNNLIDYFLSSWRTYILGGIILGVINITIRPILKLLSLPFYLIFFSLIGFIINGILLKLFDYIVNVVLQIPGISYTINGTVDFIIAVVIFTFLNMIYSLIFSKK